MNLFFILLFILFSGDLSVLAQTSGAAMSYEDRLDIIDDYKVAETLLSAMRRHIKNRSYQKLHEQSTVLRSLLIVWGKAKNDIRGLRSPFYRFSYAQKNPFGISVFLGHSTVHLHKLKPALNFKSIKYLP